MAEQARQRLNLERYIIDLRRDFEIACLEQRSNNDLMKDWTGARGWMIIVSKTNSSINSKSFHYIITVKKLFISSKYIFPSIFL